MQTVRVDIARTERGRAACERKTAFLSHLCTKTIILPRQARDKHRENSKKDAVFRTEITVWQLGLCNAQSFPAGVSQSFLLTVCPEPVLVNGRLFFHERI
jgi:hypothetical protein